MIEHQFLNDDPTEWLLASEDPSLRLRVYRDLLESPPPDSLQGEAETFLGMKGEGAAGNDREPDLLYTGRVWFFAEGVHCGLDSGNENLQATGDWICEKYQNIDGGFAYSWYPPLADAQRTGELTCYLIQAGFRDSRVDSAIQWILNHQRDDGGWLHAPNASWMDLMGLILFKKAGKGLKFEPEEKIGSCPYATLACLRALMAHDLHVHVRNIERGMNFMLEKGLLPGKGFPTIPSRRYWNRRPFLPGVPVLTQLDSIALIEACIQSGQSNKPACTELFNYLMSLQSSYGRWQCLNRSDGMLHRSKVELDRWVTLRICRMLRNLTISS
jgi:hypothetical protein